MPLRALVGVQGHSLQLVSDLVFTRQHADVDTCTDRQSGTNRAVSARLA